LKTSNKIFAHFFNTYGAFTSNVSIKVWELRDVHRAEHLYKEVTMVMDINSMLGNIDEIGTELVGTTIEVVDLNIKKSIMLQSSDASDFLNYRIDVAVYPL
jgi:hypothetical protein